MLYLWYYYKILLNFEVLHLEFKADFLNIFNLIKKCIVYNIFHNYI